MKFHQNWLILRKACLHFGIHSWTIMDPSGPLHASQLQIWRRKLILCNGSCGIAYAPCISHLYNLYNIFTFTQKLTGPNVGTHTFTRFFRQINAGGWGPRLLSPTISPKPSRAAQDCKGGMPKQLGIGTAEVSRKFQKPWETCRVYVAKIEKSQALTAGFWNLLISTATRCHVTGYEVLLCNERHLRTILILISRKSEIAIATLWFVVICLIILIKGQMLGYPLHIDPLCFKL